VIGEGRAESGAEELLLAEEELRAAEKLLDRALL
jgi:hypothetical protein